MNNKQNNNIQNNQQDHTNTKYNIEHMVYDNFDVVVIGAGLAGATVSLDLASRGHTVLMITKNTLTECNSFYAQGGIAAVLSSNSADSIQSHIDDTIVAGAYLSNLDTVKHVVKSSAMAVEWLINMGVSFTPNVEHELDQELKSRSVVDKIRIHKEQNYLASKFHLTKEGGHRARRILHIDDNTGMAIINTLSDKLRQHPNITIFEYCIAIELIVDKQHNRCMGFYALNIKLNQIFTVIAKYTVLATGGNGKVYLYTTNPDVATGDGIALARRANCRVANMEFIQFHPTCLYHHLAKSFLISEAVRGEGGILKLLNKTDEESLLLDNIHNIDNTNYYNKINKDTLRFMAMHDDRLELAPRDIVARAIDYEMKKHGLDCVFLDITHQNSDFIMQHFPNIYNKCKSLGIDITKDSIPVVPAAHYNCGGIVTNLCGKTDLDNLYAIGECAFTGLHGANRLASNSLLECIVFGRAASEDIDCKLSSDVKLMFDYRSVQQIHMNKQYQSHTTKDEEIFISHSWDELRKTMWDYVGIVRSNKRLNLALSRILLLKNEVEEFYTNFAINKNLIELRNLILNAELIVHSALKRQESRGLHYSLDYPNQNILAVDTII